MQIPQALYIYIFFCRSTVRLYFLSGEFHEQRVVCSFQQYLFRHSGLVPRLHLSAVCRTLCHPFICSSVSSLSAFRIFLLNRTNVTTCVAKAHNNSQYNYLFHTLVITVLVSQHFSTKSNLYYCFFIIVVHVV